MYACSACATCAFIDTYPIRLYSHYSIIHSSVLPFLCIECSSGKPKLAPMPSSPPSSQFKSSPLSGPIPSFSSFDDDEGDGDGGDK